MALPETYKRPIPITWGYLGNLVLFSVFLFPTNLLFAQNEQSRRDYSSPGLLIETGGRTGTCDVLTFTKDGQHLLAAGEDKVVRNWKLIDGNLQKSNFPTLRWKIWKGQRGHIYATALSPDKENRLVAVAGVGVKNSQIAVIDRFTGEVKYGLWELGNQQRGAIWSLAFSPDGKQIAYGSDDGSVWVWDLMNNPKDKARLVGKHKAGQNAKNKVLLVTFLQNGKEIVSVDQQGQAMQWPVPAQKPLPGKQLFHLQAKEPLVQAILSPDRKKLALGGGPKSVWIRSFPDGKATGSLSLKIPGQFVQRIAFDGTGKTLALAIRHVDQKANFFRELDPQIYIHDVSGNNPKFLYSIPAVYRVEGLAFHPQKKMLAVAGGENHEVTLWDLQNQPPQKVNTIQGKGRPLWGVAFSAENPFVVGFQDQLDPKIPHPNKRGQGPWHVFGIKKRQWIRTQEFKPLATIESWQGWQVLTTNNEVKRADTWWVKSPQGQIWHLDHNPAVYGFPTCYAFLPPKGLKPLRVAVGHYYGVSIFDLPPPQHLVFENQDLKATSIKPSRSMVGHEGEVTALAISKDQTFMVTTSRDQTLAGWSLEDWPSHPELGARFIVQQNKLTVIGLDDGSPAWEAGLKVGDEIVYLKDSGEVIYSALPNAPKVGTPQVAQQHLLRAIPGQELFFAWDRKGEKGIQYQLTTVRQRPTWQFFPTQDQEWVLWRWREFYYDCSTNGDFNIGFQESGPTVHDTPKFYRAEQFREKLHDPKKMKTLFEKGGKLVRLPEIAPPKEIAIEAVSVKPLNLKGDLLISLDKNDLTVDLSAKARGEGPNDQLDQAILWINDYQFQTWPVTGALFKTRIKIPREKLRQGVNELILQCYNEGNVRGESTPIRVVFERRNIPRTLFGVIIGVGDYRKSSPRQNDLKANKDAKKIYELLKDQKVGANNKVQVFPPLLDEKVTRDNILDLFQKIKKEVKPDDVLVVHIGGHGARPLDIKKGINIEEQLLQRAVKDDPQLKPEVKERQQALAKSIQSLSGLEGFFFCCANFNLEKLRETTLNFDDMYSLLVQLPCHKVIILDTCHSGDVEEYGVKNNIIRTLTPDGMGPVILAACQPDQSAYEHPYVDPHMFGVFTAALRMTMDDNFSLADKDKNGMLDPQEIFQETHLVVTAIMEDLGKEQEPILFLPRLEKQLQVIGK